MLNHRAVARAMSGTADCSSPLSGWRRAVTPRQAQPSIQPAPRRAADSDPASEQETGNRPEFGTAGISHHRREDMSRAEPAHDDSEGAPACARPEWRQSQQEQENTGYQSRPSLCCTKRPPVRGILVTT